MNQIPTIGQAARKKCNERELSLEPETQIVYTSMTITTDRKVRIRSGCFYEILYSSDLLSFPLHLMLFLMEGKHECQNQCYKSVPLVNLQVSHLFSVPYVGSISSCSMQSISQINYRFQRKSLKQA